MKFGGMANFNILTKGKKVIFTNIETNEKLEFFSIREASTLMRVSRNTILIYLKSQKLYRGKSKISFDEN